MKDNRLRLLAIERIVKENPNGVTVKMILNVLKSRYDIDTERKTVYSDLAALTYFLPIKKEHFGKTQIYKLRY